MNSNKAALLFALLAFSCTRLSTDQPESVTTVCFTVGGVKGVLDERRVSHLDVFVFRRSTGLLETCLSSSSGSTVATLPRGPLFDWYAVANGPRSLYENIISKEQFLSLKTSVEDNLGGECVMKAQGSKAFSASKDTVRLNLKRYLSKVTLESLEMRFVPDSSGVTLAGAFLINVNGQEPISGVPSISEVWHNRLCRTDTISFYEHNDSIPLSPGPPIPLGWSFYCLPNPLTLSEDRTVATHPEWSPRCTRLVIELCSGGQPSYYSTTIPAMQSNREYVITQAILTGPGTTEPDRSVANMEAFLDVRVLPWETDSTDIHFIN